MSCIKLFVTVGVPLEIFIHFQINIKLRIIEAVIIKAGHKVVRPALNSPLSYSLPNQIVRT